MASNQKLREIRNKLMNILKIHQHELTPTEAMSIMADVVGQTIANCAGGNQSLRDDLADKFPPAVKQSATRWWEHLRVHGTFIN